MDKKNNAEKSKCGGSDNVFVGSNGEIFFVVIRMSFNIIDFDLPYFLFGYLYLQQGAASMYNLLKPFLNGMTLAVDIVNNEQVRFTYSLGPKTDTIVVFMPPPYSLISYVDFIQSLPTQSLTSNLMTVTYNLPSTDFLPLLDIPKATLGNLYSMAGCPYYFYEISSLTNVGGAKMANAIFPAGRLNSSQTILQKDQYGAEICTMSVDMYLPQAKINSQTAWITFFKSGLKRGDGYLLYVEGVMVNTVNIVLCEKFNLNDRAEQIYNEKK